MTRDYLNSGHSGNRLLSELGLIILKDDNGWSLLHTLRTVFDEWEHCAGHPARGQLLVGLARWATDARRSIGSQSAAQTAQLLPAGRPRSSCTNNTAGGVRCADSLPLLRNPAEYTSHRRIHRLHGTATDGKQADSCPRAFTCCALP